MNLTETECCSQAADLTPILIAAIAAGGSLITNLWQIYYKYHSRDNNPQKPNYFSSIVSNCCTGGTST